MSIIPRDCKIRSLSPHEQTWLSLLREQWHKVLRTSEAENIASEVLYQGLHFSKYDTLVSVLENEFERELPAPLPDKLAPILLSNEAVQATFDKFGLTDTLASDEQYGRLYTELTGTIVLLIESNNLPTVRLTEEASLKACRQRRRTQSS